MLAVAVGAVAVFGLGEGTRLLRPAFAEAAPTSSPTGKPSVSPSGGRNCSIVGTQGGSPTCNNGDVYNKNVTRKTIRNNTYVAPPQIGVLHPANEPSPPTKCHFDNHSMLVYFGSNVSDVALPIFNLLTEGNKPIIQMKKLGDSLVISDLRLVGSDGKIALQLDSEGYWGSGNAHIVKRENGSVVAVYNDLGDEILWIKYLNKRAVVVRGVFNWPDHPTTKITDSEMFVGPPLRMSVSGACMMGMFGAIALG
jgi:hypothetical protein